MIDLPCGDTEHGLGAIQERTARRCVPFSAQWELTYRCNLRCRHCYVRPEIVDRELSTAECIDALGQLADAGFFFLLLTGGEPLVREDFFEIAGEARRLTFALKILTNGYLVDGETADRIASLNPVAVDVSLYGRPEAHDGITGVPGSQERSLGALRMLRERGLVARVKSPIMRSNLSEYEYLRGVADELGCSFIFDATVCPADDGDRAPLAERLSAEETEDLLLRALRGKPMESGGNHVDGEPVCNAGRNTCRIRPNGDVTPCVAIGEPVGNITEERLTRLWGSIAFKKYRAMTPGKLHECRSCEMRDFCVRCPGLAQLEDGDLFGRSTAACEVARARKKLHGGAAAG